VDADDQAKRDAEVQGAFVGPSTPHNAVVRLSDYDAAWPELYEREAARIRGVLGDRVVLLEHVGSTSIPGMAAKPQIDIVLAVADSAREDEYVPDLEAAGYALRIREPDWHEHRMFKGPDTNINMHTFSAGSAEIERMVGFRDWLRTHPDDFARYLNTKRELSGRTWRWVQDYADAKSEVVDEITRRAGLPERSQGVAPPASASAPLPT
jgi:GrpB-like predicted nucleotidyltransferase (UPF0157 family)